MEVQGGLSEESWESLDSSDKKKYLEQHPHSKYAERENFKVSKNLRQLYKDDWKKYKEYLQKKDSPETKEFHKMAMDNNRISQDYKNAISSWLKEKNKPASFRDEKKVSELGAEVGRLKKLAQSSDSNLQEFRDKHYDKIWHGLIQERPRLGYSRGNKIKELTPEEREKYFNRTTYTQRNRFSK